MCKSDRYKIGIKLLLRGDVVMPLSGLEFEEFYCVELRISNTVIRYKITVMNQSERLMKFRYT